jgi:hypothetical protein
MPSSLFPFFLSLNDRSKREGEKRDQEKERQREKERRKNEWS